MDEALTRAQRIKRSRIMKQKSGIIARKREIAMRRKASPEKLKKRAMKKARGIIIKKILKKRDRSELGFGELENLEKKLSVKKAVIKKIAKKLLPQVKQDETERLAKLRSKK